MSDTIGSDLAWMMGIIQKHVPCTCYTLALWRACGHKPWCLRATHLQRLRFFRDGLAFDLAMKGIATIPPLGDVSTLPTRP
jgi:hypothetical protein